MNVSSKMLSPRASYFAKHLSSNTTLFFFLLQNYECRTDDLRPVCELGRGAYGVVEKMSHKTTNIDIAVKVSCL